MIKKSFKTIKENPIIIAALFAPLIFSVINIIAFKDTRIAMYPLLIKELNDPVVLINTVYTLLYVVGYTLFLYPVISRYIYLKVKDIHTEKWYKKCFRGFWWRALAVKIVVVIILIAVLMPLAVYTVFVYYGTSTIVLTVVLAIGGGLFLFAIASFSFIAESAAFAEESFYDGLSNMYDAWKKNFRRLALLTVVMLLIFAVLIEVAYTYGAMLGNWFQIIFLFTMSGASMFTCVYSMHCYLDYKKTTLIPVGDDQIEIEEQT